MYWYLLSASLEWAGAQFRTFGASPLLHAPSTRLVPCLSLLLLLLLLLFWFCALLRPLSAVACIYLPFSFSVLLASSCLYSLLSTIYSLHTYTFLEYNDISIKRTITSGSDCGTYALFVLQNQSINQSIASCVIANHYTVCPHVHITLFTYRQFAFQPF